MEKKDTAVTSSRTHMLPTLRNSCQTLGCGKSLGIIIMDPCLWLSFVKSPKGWLHNMYNIILVVSALCKLYTLALKPHPFPRRRRGFKARYIIVHMYTNLYSCVRGS